MSDLNEHDVLTRKDSLRLLESAPIGRIAFTDHALPVVQPVPFLLDDGSVVIRTGNGAKLAAVARNAVVAFQADHLDPRSHRGWAVLVVGRTAQITDPEEITRLDAKMPPSWFGTDQDGLIRISVEMIDGWRLRPAKTSESKTETPVDTGPAV